jgi:hypothetical protein
MSVNTPEVVTVNITCMTCQVSYDLTLEQGCTVDRVANMACGHCGSDRLILTMFRKHLAILTWHWRHR